MVVVEVIVLLVALGTVAVLEVVVAIIAPVLEGVDVTVGSTSIAVVSGTRSSKWSTLK